MESIPKINQQVKGYTIGVQQKTAPLRRQRSGLGTARTLLNLLRLRSHRGALFQRFRLVRRFPTEAIFSTAEVSERRRLPIDWTTQLQVIDDAPRSQNEILAHQFRE